MKSATFKLCIIRPCSGTFYRWKTFNALHIKLCTGIDCSRKSLPRLLSGCASWASCGWGVSTPGPLVTTSPDALLCPAKAGAPAGQGKPDQELILEESTGTALAHSVDAHVLPVGETT